MAVPLPAGLDHQTSTLRKRAQAPSGLALSETSAGSCRCFATAQWSAPTADSGFSTLLGEYRTRRRTIV